MLESLEFTTPLVEQAFYSLMMLLIVSILTNLYFFNDRLIKKHQSKLSKAEQHKLIQKFINDQKEKTTNAKRHNQRKHLSKHVIKLRSAYLAIESKAIDRTIDSSAYWNFLYLNLKKVYDILTSKKQDTEHRLVDQKIQYIREKLENSPDSESKATALNILDRFQAECRKHINDPQKQAFYANKIEKLVEKLEDAEYRRFVEKRGHHDQFIQQSKKPLNSMQEQIDSCRTSAKNLGKRGTTKINDNIDTLENNNDKIETSLNTYRTNIESIENKLRNEPPEAVIKMSSERLEKASQDLDELSDEIQEANEQEIQRLRKVIRDQKLVIKELEENIHSAEDKNLESKSSNKEGFDTDNDIPLLKRYLKEAEYCIHSLESELTELKNSQADHKARQDDITVDPELSEHNIRELNSTIEQLREELENHQNKESLQAMILQFLRECLDASSVEDISILIFETLKNADWDPSLIIFGVERRMEIDPQNALSKRDKILINSMQINEFNHRDNTNAIAFRLRNFGGLLKDASDGKKTTEEKQLITDLMRTTDIILSRIKLFQQQKRHRDKIDQAANSMKYMIHEIDKSFEKISRHGEETVRDTFDDLRRVMATKGTDATFVAKLKSAEQNVLTELAADETIRLKTKKQFLLLLKKLEEDE